MSMQSAVIGAYTESTLTVWRMQRACSCFGDFRYNPVSILNFTLTLGLLHVCGVRRWCNSVERRSWWLPCRLVLLCMQGSIFTVFLSQISMECALYIIYNAHSMKIGSETPCQFDDDLCVPLRTREHAESAEGATVAEGLSFLAVKPL